MYKEFQIDDDDVIKMAMDTAGHSVRDLTDYLNRKIFKAVKKKSNIFLWIVFFYIKITCLFRVGIVETLNADLTIAIDSCHS